MRPEVRGYIGALLARCAAHGRVDLNDIDDVIGRGAVSYEEVEAIIEALEAAGLEVGEPLRQLDLDVVHEVLRAARGLQASGVKPTVAALASATGRPEPVVRRALEQASSPARRAAAK